MINHQHHSTLLERRKRRITAASFLRATFRRPIDDETKESCSRIFEWLRARQIAARHEAEAKEKARSKKKPEESAEKKVEATSDATTTSSVKESPTPAAASATSE